MSLVHTFTYLYSIPFIMWQFVFLILWWLLLLRGHVFSLNQKRITIGVLCVASAIMLLYFTKYYRPQALIARDAVALRMGPASTFPVRSLLALDQEVQLVKKSNQWYYVTLLPHVSPNVESNQADVAGINQPAKLTGWVHQGEIMSKRTS